ncbi:MAG: hypothetical protein WD767_00205 [Alphaproteobacteria bacterium]
MNRIDIVEQLLREMAEEMPVLLRALPDDGLWRAMASGLLADEETEALAARIAEGNTSFAGAPDWREVYGEMRAMVNEWPAGHLSAAAG